MNFTLDFGALLGNGYPTLILGGLATTLEMTLLAWLLAFALGSLLAVLRMLNLRGLNWLIALYVAFHRNVPMLVHILLWYFGVEAIVPSALNDAINIIGGAFLYATIANGLVTADYVRDYLRSAIRALPRGQMEIGRASCRERVVQDW